MLLPRHPCLAPIALVASFTCLSSGCASSGSNEALIRENERLRGEVARLSAAIQRAQAAPAASSSAAQPAPTGSIEFASLGPPPNLVMGQVSERPWYRVVVVGTKVCSTRERAGETKSVLFGVEVVIDNLGGKSMRIEPELEEASGQRHRPPFSYHGEDKCGPELPLRDIPAASRQRGWIMYDLTSIPMRPRLRVPMNEPRGFAEEELIVDLDPAHGSKTAAQLPAAPTAQPAQAQTGSTRKTPYYSVSVTDVRRCTLKWVSRRPPPPTEANTLLVGVEILVESTATKTFSVHGDATLRDSRGYDYTPEDRYGLETAECMPLLRQNEVPPQGKVRGFVHLFRIKADAKGLKLTVRLGREEEVTLDAGDAPTR
ncbi:MAG: hypothetical protein HY898_30065 [Deltaproteobacteria bacterium]|nr:hypothetical protein [Deltaproteobacteria bacterium]